jgi:arylsulfatase A
MMVAGLRAADEPKTAKPNFIVINIDDLGYADIGPFGSKINRTPHLGTMAKEGRRLTSFYAAPVCSPSRAALMTGCYPKRSLPIPHVLFPGIDVGLAPSEVTVAEILKAEGYATAIIGKWHLGDQPEFLPNQQGFDFYFGLPYSNDMGPAEDGVKSDLGKPLPKSKGSQQPPLPLLRNGTVLKRVLPDDQQSPRPGLSSCTYPTMPSTSPFTPARSGPENRRTASSRTGLRKWIGASARFSMPFANRTSPSGRS